jgi:hypothetical protein
MIFLQITGQIRQKERMYSEAVDFIDKSSNLSDLSDLSGGQKNQMWQSNNCSSGNR